MKVRGFGKFEAFIENGEISVVIEGFDFDAEGENDPPDIQAEKCLRSVLSLIESSIKNGYNPSGYRVVQTVTLTGDNVDF